MQYRILLISERKSQDKGKINCEKCGIKSDAKGKKFNQFSLQYSTSQNSNDNAIYIFFRVDYAKHLVDNFWFIWGTENKSN